ncbi:MAG: hypothetical protein ACPG4T_14905, partial [Nannocystaceae bacterium]
AVDGRQPFECIGTPGEVALYLTLCQARGYRGQAVDLVLDRPVSAASIDRYLSVDLTALPEDLASQLGPQLMRAASRARDYLAANSARPSH